MISVSVQKPWHFFINRHDPKSLQAAPGASQPEGPSTETVVMVSDAPMRLDLTRFWSKEMKGWSEDPIYIITHKNSGGGHLKCIEYRLIDDLN